MAAPDRRRGVKQFMQAVWGDLQGAIPRQLIQTGPGSDLDQVIAQTTPILAHTLEKAVPLPKDQE